MVIDLALTPKSVVNVSKVPHRSPFRYPGGKTWLVPFVRRWLKSKTIPVKEFVEPFAGGAIVGLSAVFEDLAERLTLIEKDADVASVWWTILRGKGQKLAEMILSFSLTEGNVKRILSGNIDNQLDRAFATILKNRVHRGGILAAGSSLMKKGENGRGIASRWYPETLKGRILDIVKYRKRITFLQVDGIAIIRDLAQKEDHVFFIDPPYTVAGRRLYTHSDIDHEELFRVVSSIRGDFLMSYDNTPQIRFLAKKHHLRCEEISMKNTHHSVMTELLIGKNLAWL